MSSEDRIEAKVWLQNNADCEIGTLDVAQTKKLLTALYAAGAENVWIVKKYLDHVFNHTDVLHIEVGLLKVGNVMSRLANYHPDKVTLPSKDGSRIVEAWWD